MPKYRILSSDELSALEKEFIEFLILNGITADDWIEMKESDTEGTLRLIELFSDVVFESILRRTSFIESRGPKHVHIFQCLAQQLVLVAMEARDDNDEVDFTNADFLASSMLTPPQNVKVFTTTKPYTVQREEEIFQMLENGCTITDDKLFKALCLVL